MSEHTPGPWRAERSIPEELVDCWWIVAADGSIIASTETVYGIDNMEDNAALIARAPELLEENKRLKNRIDELEAEQEWYPIETAPRNGDWFVARTEVEYSQELWVGIVRYANPSDNYLQAMNYEGYIYDRVYGATHWKPRPKIGGKV